MIRYLIKTEIDGVELRLIQSRYGYVTVYGMDRATHKTLADALADYNGCVRHALQSV